MKISATFLDEVTFDIPSNNWGYEEWDKDFELMKATGIDTVIQIRAGLRNISSYPSKVLKKYVNAMELYRDMVDVFLELSEKHNMDYYFGTYDSWKYRLEGNFALETEINRAVIEEAWEKYGHRKAFKGWYLTYEIAKKHNESVKMISDLGQYAKDISGGLPVLISPYLHGFKQFNDPITPEEHRKDWDSILSELQGKVDIVAFQDGHVDFADLPEFSRINVDLIKKYGMSAWSNIETFDRDSPFDFPPIDWNKLWWKLRTSEQTGVEKIVTFEFSHFLSPNSCWPAAGNLFKRYCEHFMIGQPGNIATRKSFQDKIAITDIKRTRSAKISEKKCMDKSNI